MQKLMISLLALVVSLPSWVYAQGLLNYKPPQFGAPSARIPGGTRGLSLHESKIQVLAPKHTALTGQAQPVLYWHLSEASQQWLEVTLLKAGSDQPILKKQVPAFSAGLQSLALADFDVFLEPGHDYHWSVAVINDAESAKQEACKASIRYQVPSAPLNSVEKLAEAGYWYDALQQLIEAHSPRANELLSQIGLSVTIW